MEVATRLFAGYVHFRTNAKVHRFCFYNLEFAIYLLAVAQRKQATPWAHWLLSLIISCAS
jgi:hypothetical protein